MPERVIPAPKKQDDPDPLTLGEKETWAAYMTSAVVAEVKRAAKLDGYPSASAYAQTLLIFALRAREAERIADRKK